MKRYVFCFLALAFVLCIGFPTRADQAPANDFAGQISTDGKTGRVGIGTRVPAATLDVYQGEVKVGSSGAKCTRSVEGAIRYADKSLQFCDGEGWRSVSTASTPP